MSDFVIDNGVLVKYTGQAHRVVIPEGVTGIGAYAFDECLSLVSVKIPKGVTKIGECAFTGCQNLTSIELPDGLTEIGAGAFMGCESLESIVIPDGVTSIGRCAFLGCRGLKSIVIPGSVMEIGKEALGRCESLQYIKTGVKIPEEACSGGGFGTPLVTEDPAMIPSPFWAGALIAYIDEPDAPDTPRSKAHRAHIRAYKDALFYLAGYRRGLFEEMLRKRMLERETAQACLDTAMKRRWRKTTVMLQAYLQTLPADDADADKN